MEPSQIDAVIVEGFLSQIELAVQDMDRAAEFYQALGWLRADGPEGMVTFDLAGKTLGLYCKSVSGQNAGSDMRRGRYSGTIVAHNLVNKSDVAPLLERARSAGATVLKEA